MTKKNPLPKLRQVHLSPDNCEAFWMILNGVPVKDAGGLRYSMQLADVIKALSAERKKNLLDAREKFGRRHDRIPTGQEEIAKNKERDQINQELWAWMEEKKVTNSCFPSAPQTIAFTIPPESDTVILNALLFHFRIQRGPGLVQICEICDALDLRDEFEAEAEKLDTIDEEAEAEAEKKKK